MSNIIEHQLENRKHLASQFSNKSSVDFSVIEKTVQTLNKSFEDGLVKEELFDKTIGVLKQKIEKAIDNTPHQVAIIGQRGQSSFMIVKNGKNFKQDAVATIAGTEFKKSVDGWVENTDTIEKGLSDNDFVSVDDMDIVKAFDLLGDEIDIDLVKGGKRVPVGTIKELKGGIRYQKTNDGWVYMKKDKKGKGDESGENSDSKVDKQALASFLDKHKFTKKEMEDFDYVSEKIENFAENEEINLKEGEALFLAREYSSNKRKSESGEKANPNQEQLNAWKERLKTAKTAEEKDVAQKWVDHLSKDNKSDSGEKEINQIHSDLGKKMDSIKKEIVSSNGVHSYTDKNGKYHSSKAGESKHNFAMRVASEKSDSVETKAEGEGKEKKISFTEATKFAKKEGLFVSHSDKKFYHNGTEYIPKKREDGTIKFLPNYKNKN